MLDCSELIFGRMETNFWEDMIGLMDMGESHSTELSFAALNGDP